MMISILITTKDRPEDIMLCLTSVLQSTFDDYEVIVIDQSLNDKTKEVTLAFQNPTFHYISCIKGSKSHALNTGIQYSQGAIIAITDDDCIVDKNWLTQIDRFYESHPKISGMFGQVKPFQPNKHQHLYCPSTFQYASYKTIRYPQTHWNHIGLGNNMSFRSIIFTTFGPFKEWLGYGSPGGPSEDAEIALRLLVHKHPLVYNPQALVYHNRWITHTDMNKLKRVYLHCNIVCYAYFAFQWYSFAYSIAKNEIAENIRIITNHVSLLTIIKLGSEICIITSKLAIALFYAVADPV